MFLELRKVYAVIIKLKMTIISLVKIYFIKYKLYNGY